MSRIGKKPIVIPDKVKIDIKPDSIVVTGPKGTCANPIPPGIRFENKEKQLLAIRKDDSGPQRAFHGLARALVANAVKGVTDRFFEGTGYCRGRLPCGSEEELGRVYSRFFTSY